MTAPLDPRSVVKAAVARIKQVPGSTYTPVATPEMPDPDPIEVPSRVIIGPADEDIPAALKSADGKFNLGAGMGLMWALLQSMEIRTVTGHVTLTTIPGGVGGTIWAAGASFEKTVAWDAVAPEIPTGVLVSAEAGILSAGKTVATLKPDTATTTGATLVCKNVSGGNVIVNASNPITYNAQALYLYTPPLETL